MELNNKLDKFAKLPDVVLNDITSNPDAEQDRGDTESSDFANDGVVSDNDVMQTRQGFQAANDNPFSAGATSPNAAPGPNAQNPFAPGGFNPNGFNNNGTKAGQLIGGKFATDLLNSILPAASVYLFHALGYKIKKSELELSADEKKVIAPAMQRYLDTINIDFSNPLYNLLFVVGTIYGAKIIEKLPNVEKVEKKAPAKTSRTQTPVNDKAERFEALVKDTMRKRKKGRADAIKHIREQQQKQRA